MITRVNKKYFLYTALIIMYYEWLLILSEAAANIMTDAYSDGVSFLAAYNDELPPIYHQTKSNIERIIIGNNHLYKYDESDYQKDKTLITDILLSIWLLDECMLRHLLDKGYDFRIVFLANHFYFSTNESNAVFDSEFNTLALPAKIHEHLIETTHQKVAHELQHAVDSYNNLLNGYCVDNKTMRAMPYLHSRHRLFSDCSADIKSRNATEKLLIQDFHRINQMLSSLSKNSKYRTASEKQSISTLAQFIKVHQYSVRPAELYFESNENHFMESILERYNYSYDDTSKRYTYTDTIYIHEIPMRYLNYSYAFSIHLTDYSVKKLMSTAYLVNPHSEGMKPLIQDLLQNVIRLIVTTRQSKSDDVFLFEVSAYLTQFLTTYAKPVQFKHEVTTLRNWLFPHFHAHEKTRYSESYAACKNQQLSAPKLRVS